MAQLVPLERRHLEELRKIRSDPEISKWLISPSGHISAAAQERWFERYLEDPSIRIWMLVESGKVRGYGQLCCIDLFHQSAELGVVIAPRHQGAGSGRMIIRRLLKIAYEELGMHRVELTVFEDNEKAIRAYQGCGFSIDGVLRDAAFKDGQFRNLMVMSRLSTDE